MCMRLALLAVTRDLTLAGALIGGLLCLGVAAPAAAAQKTPSAAKDAAPTPPPQSAAPAASAPPPQSAAPATPAATATPIPSAQKAPATPKGPLPPPLLPPPARLWLIAPTTGAPWMLRLDNEGERPLRVAADIRLLSLEIEITDTHHKNKKKTVRCAAPSGMRPESFPEKRALLLPPGYSYMEAFDPHLLCFGKDAAAITGGVLVRGRLGWSPPSKWAAKKAPEPPFVVESTDDPTSFAPERGLNAPPLVLSYAAPPDPQAGAAEGLEQPNATGSTDTPSVTPDKPAPDKPAPDKPAPAATDKPSLTETGKTSTPPLDKPSAEAALEPAPVVDANAPRIQLTADRWSDASSPRTATISVKAENAGKRPMTVALLPRMLAFRIEGPEGTVMCEADPPTDAVPRDLFRTLKPGASAAFKVLLKEVCPEGALQREGLYRVTPILHANEPGASIGLDAYTAVVAAEKPAVLRLQSAPAPFYTAPPKAVPTPMPSDEEAE